MYCLNFICQMILSLSFLSNKLKWFVHFYVLLEQLYGTVYNFLLFGINFQFSISDWLLLFELYWLHLSCSLFFQWVYMSIYKIYIIYIVHIFQVNLQTLLLSSLLSSEIFHLIQSQFRRETIIVYNNDIHMSESFGLLECKDNINERKSSKQID